MPRIQENDEFDISAARWVLVIEKEVRMILFRQRFVHEVSTLNLLIQAVFHRLVRNDYHNKAVVGQGILITVSSRFLQPRNRE